MRSDSVLVIGCLKWIVSASLMGPSLSLPVAQGRLALGTWQGIYLCEHRDRGGARSLVATLNGQSRLEP